MKLHKRLTAAALALLCLLGSLAPASAGETEGKAEEPQVPAATFTNEYNPMPDLYVTKTVESADDRYPAPEDAEFTFTLKLDGKLAENRRYRVYGPDGAEIQKPNHEPFKTSRSGDFTLKAGQTACFEAVGAGVAYEITEQPRKDFIQITPPGGGAASGTTTTEGAAVVFTNQYLPPSTEETYTKLTVTKRISFPEGYQLPPDAEEFGYTLELNGKPYANEPYTVTDTETGEKVGTGTTDQKGHFLLDGGQTAAFEKVKADVDYRITEDEKEGWWAVGDRVQEGATQAPVTAITYTNATAAFIVTKTLEDKTEPEVDFTFQLTDAGQKAWPGAQYYLYQTSGERADDTVRQTDEKGNFSLRPGQAAVFFGIQPGTVYHVKEQAHPDYTQQIPVYADGYTNKVVKDLAEVLPFVNRPAPAGRILRVTKQIEQTGAEAPLFQDTFQFRLSCKEGDEWKPVAKTGYYVEIGTSQMTYETDGQGAFTLRANETATFDGLPAGTYRVEETGMSSEYEPKDALVSQEGVLEQETLSFTFTNLYTPKMLDLYLVKKNQEGQLLSGAEFMLYRDEQLNNPVTPDPYQTDGEGRITIPDLKAGTYYLVETKSPEGYQLLANPIKIELVRKGNHIQVAIDGTVYEPSETEDPKGDIYVVEQETKNDEVHITVYNNKNFGLPLTGGTGTLLFGGGVLLAMAVLFLTLWKLGKKKKTMP